MYPHCESTLEACLRRQQAEMMHSRADTPVQNGQKRDLQRKLDLTVARMEPYLFWPFRKLVVKFHDVVT